MKTCTLCKTSKDPSCFNRDKRMKDGLQSQCKTCNAINTKKWREAKPDMYLSGQAAVREERKLNGKDEAYSKARRDSGAIATYAAERRLQPNVRILAALRSRLTAAVRRGYKSAKTVDLLGCSVEDLRVYLQSQFIAGMSWENHGKWHIDHKQPCASFDLTDPEQQRLCFHFSNLQPLWALDNILKSDRTT